MLFFIYGTLKDDCCNHHILKNINAKFISNAISIDLYPMYKSEYYFPYVEDHKGIGYNIKGQLYEIKKNKEKYLDDFEGVPDLYKKGLISVISSNNIEYLNVNIYYKATNSKRVNDLISEWLE